MYFDAADEDDNYARPNFGQFQEGVDLTNVASKPHLLPNDRTPPFLFLTFEVY